MTKWSYPMIIMGILYASLAHAASTYEMWFGYQLLVPTMLISRRIIKARHQWFDYLFFIVGVYLITVVGSRGPLLIVGVYLVVSFVMRIRECKKIPVNANLKDYLKNEKTYVIMSVLLLFGLFILIIGIVWIKPISSAIYSALAQSGIESRTLRVLSERGLLFLSGRGEIYEEAIKAIGNRPWLGYGIGGDCVYIGSIVYGYPPETSIGTYPHNLVLELLMQYGIPAGFFILSVFIAITKRGIYAVKKESTDQKDIYYVFLTIAFVSLLFSGTYLNSKYLWMLFGLAISFCRTHRSRAIAEMEKILENTYRNINIGLINELAILCDRMGISIWEVIDAAKSKPYGFQPFYPGPGLGGHCIPLDPYYLSWKAREYGFHTSMIESSMMINDRMPEYCVERAAKILNRFKKAMNGASVLVIGVAYKQDIDDYRESPAIRVIEALRREGAIVTYYDPWVAGFRHGGLTMTGLPALTADVLEAADLVMVTAAHTNVDYELIQKHAKAVFDTKNAMKGVANRDKIEVL